MLWVAAAITTPQTTKGHNNEQDRRQQQGKRDAQGSRIDSQRY